MVTTTGVDGCVAAVLADIANDPEKERKFRDALASLSDTECLCILLLLRQLTVSMTLKYQSLKLLP